jgi:RecA-family ATPase
MTFGEWRDRCPYGKWTCADGREVLFNRSYWPILERRPAQQGLPFVITEATKQKLRAQGVTDDEIHEMTPAQAHERLAEPRAYEPAKPANPNEWVGYVRAENFWDDSDDPQGNPATLEDVNEILAAWGVETLPWPPTRPSWSRQHWDGEEDPPRENPWFYPFGAAPNFGGGDYEDADEDDADLARERNPAEAEAEVAKQLARMRQKMKMPVRDADNALAALRERGIHVSEPLTAGVHSAKCPCCDDENLEVVVDFEGQWVRWYCYECHEHGGVMPPRRIAGADVIPLINMRTWDGVSPPQQEWAVCSRVPTGHVSLFSGEGGTGKSLIMLQLAVDVALGRDWFGAPVKRGPALVIDAEDDEKIIHKRLADILDHHDGVRFADVRRDLHVASLAGEDAVMATFDRKSGKMEPTPLYEALLEMVGDIKPVMTGIAASADVFAGDEIDRSQVRQFIALLTRLAMTAGGAVVLISHPSLSGISSGSGLSGSTAWHNSVRSRFYLKGIKPKKGEDDDDAPDTDLRVIEFRKNNYGPVCESITLRYQNGLFVPITAAPTADAAAREAEADGVFLAALARFTYQKQTLSPNAKANNYAPHVIAEHPETKAKGFRKGEMKAAMQRLLDAEKIHIDVQGPPSRAFARLVAGPRKLV